MEQSRFKSPIVWASVLTTLLALLGEWGVYEKIGIERQLIQSTIDFVLLGFTTFGVLNNPTKGDGF